MESRNLRLFFIGIVTAVVMAGFAVPVSAVITTNTQTDYAGGEVGNDQAVNVTYTISPVESEITDVRLDVSSTSQSFIDENSFSYTITPGSSDANVESNGDGVFTINSLGPNEEVQFTFKAYPKTIKQESIAVASISVEYVQNGQELSKTDEATADLSNSPWFQYQAAQERIESVQQSDQFSIVTVGGSLGVGLLGVVAAVFFWRRGNTRVEAEQEEFVSRLASMKTKLDARGKHEVDNLIAEYGSSGPSPNQNDGTDEGGKRPPNPPGS